MREASVGLLIVVALVGLVMAARYLAATTLMPYQQRALDRRWDEIEAGERVVMRAMLRVVGGGFLSLALTMAWAAYEIHAHNPIAPWAALVVAVAAMGPAVSATLLLRRFRPATRPPTGLALAALAIVGAGAALALLAPV